MQFYPGQRFSQELSVVRGWSIEMLRDSNRYYEKVWEVLLRLCHILPSQVRDNKELDDKEVDVLLFLLEIVKEGRRDDIFKRVLERIIEFYSSTRSKESGLEGEIYNSIRDKIINGLCILTQDKEYTLFFDKLLEIVLPRKYKVGLIGEIAIFKGLKSILSNEKYKVVIGGCEEDKRGGDIVISVNTKKGRKVVYLDVKFVYSRRDGSIEDLIVISYNPSNCVGDGKGLYNMQLKIKYQSGLNEYIDFKSFGAGRKLEKVLKVFKLVLKYLDTNIDNDNLITSISNVIKGKVTIGRENERDRGFSIIIEC